MTFIQRLQTPVVHSWMVRTENPPSKLDTTHILKDYSKFERQQWLQPKLKDNLLLCTSKTGEILVVRGRGVK